MSKSQFKEQPASHLAIGKSRFPFTMCNQKFSQTVNTNQEGNCIARNQYVRAYSSYARTSCNSRLKIRHNIPHKAKSWLPRYRRLRSRGIQSAALYTHQVGSVVFGSENMICYTFRPLNLRSTEIFLTRLTFSNYHPEVLVRIY
jgi:hypothetical protein